MLLDISTQKGYDIAGAIRGPDFSGSYEIKQLFTARIRILAGIDTTKIGGISADRRSSRVAEYDVKVTIDTIKEVGRKAYHYLYHCQQALMHLGQNESARAAEILGNWARESDWSTTPNAKEITDLLNTEFDKPKEAPINPPDWAPFTDRNTIRQPRDTNGRFNGAPSQLPDRSYWTGKFEKYPAGFKFVS